MKLVKTSQYKESPPKKILWEIFHEIETQLHYGTYRNWEILVELLANWIVQNEDLTLGSMACKPFDGLELRYKDLYNHINDLDLFKHYVTALKEQPWDYLGEIYMEQELVGLGQNMTPRAVVELMVAMVFDKRKIDSEAEWFTYNSYLNYITWYILTHHVPPRHLKPMDPPVHTQLDTLVVSAGKQTTKAKTLCRHWQILNRHQPNVSQSKPYPLRYRNQPQPLPCLSG